MEIDPQIPGGSVILREGRLPDGSIVDISIEGGLIAAVTPTVARDREPGIDTASGSAAVELGGRLVLPGFVETHAHLDKALTADLVDNPAGDLMGAIEGWQAAYAAGLLGYDSVVARARATLEMMILNGVTLVRTHVNVSDEEQVASIRAVKYAAESLAGVVDVQIVALTASPMTGSQGAANRRALERAIEEGVDLIGGCPHLDTDAVTMIDDVLTLAADADLDIDLHVDETTDARVTTLRDLARAVIDRGFTRRVAASHCVSLGMQPAAVQRSIAEEVAAAGITVIALPQTNLFLQGRDTPTARPRGITAVDALVDAGAVVLMGGDNVQDPFNPVGRADPLETAALAVVAAHVNPHTALDAVGSAARLALTGARGDLSPGTTADLVAIDASGVRDAIARAPHDRLVIRRGVVTAVSRESRRIIGVEAAR